MKKITKLGVVLMAGLMLGGIALDTHSSFDDPSSSVAYAAKKKKKSKKSTKKTIKLDKYGEFQFSGMANIKPTKAKINKKKLSFYFDWRNDDSMGNEFSLEGSGVTIVAYQNGKELKQYSDDYSGADQQIEKNTSLEIDFDYKLIDKSPVTIKMLPLEGDEQEFTFDVK